MRSGVHCVPLPVYRGAGASPESCRWREAQAGQPPQEGASPLTQALLPDLINKTTLETGSSAPGYANKREKYIDFFYWTPSLSMQKRQRIIFTRVITNMENVFEVTLIFTSKKSLQG